MKVLTNKKYENFLREIEYYKEEVRALENYKKEYNLLKDWLESAGIKIQMFISPTRARDERGIYTDNVYMSNVKVDGNKLVDFCDKQEELKELLKKINLDIYNFEDLTLLSAFLYQQFKINVNQNELFFDGYKYIEYIKRLEITEELKNLIKLSKRR